jgi:hypothetical protein
MDGRHAADIKAKSKRRDFSGSFNSWHYCNSWSHM